MKSMRKREIANCCTFDDRSNLSAAYYESTMTYLFHKSLSFVDLTSPVDDTQHQHDLSVIHGKSGKISYIET